MFSIYYGCDEYEGDYLAREQQEEFFAQADYLSEAYGATARDAARCAEEDWEAENDAHDAHVWDYLVHQAKQQVDALPRWNDDIPF